MILLFPPEKLKTIPTEYNQKIHPQDFLIHLTLSYGVMGLESQWSQVRQSEICSFCFRSEGSFHS